MLGEWPREKAAIFPNGVERTVEVFVPEGAFSPNDPWSVEARRAWSRHSITGKSVFFAGVGAHGAEVIQALHAGDTPRVVILNDVVGYHLEICQRNIVDHHTGDFWFDIVQAPGRAEAALRWAAISNGYRPDLIFGCLPQVPSTGSLTNEQIAHMYPVGDYPEMAEWGLGLIHELLAVATECLAKEGIVSLVISGRVPMSVIRYLFTRNRFETPEIAHKWIVRHHPDTPLKYLEGVDTQGQYFLFRDPSGRNPLSATEAESLRLGYICGVREDLPVFHRVFVFEATPRR